MFALRLAQSMGMTLHELQSRMTSAEFSLHVELAALDRQSHVHAAAEPASADEMEWFGNAT